MHNCAYYQKYHERCDCVKSAIHPSLVGQNVNIVNVLPGGRFVRVDYFKKSWDVVEDGQ